jgi:hypothetical protein
MKKAFIIYLQTKKQKSQRLQKDAVRSVKQLVKEPCVLA